MNVTIQKKKDSRSYFQGLLYVFECSVVIISSHYSIEKIHTLQRQTFIVVEFSKQGTQNHACTVR